MAGRPIILLQNNSVGLAENFLLSTCYLKINQRLLKVKFHERNFKTISR